MDKNHFLIQLSESERTDVGRIDFAYQTETQKVFSAIWDLESEVNNGGFEQYFASTESESIAFTPTALRTVGAARCATIVERAISLVFTTFDSAAQEARIVYLEAITDNEREQLDVLDSAFFEYPDDLTDLLFGFVASNQEIFGPIPKEIDVG